MPTKDKEPTCVWKWWEDQGWYKTGCGYVFQSDDSVYGCCPMCLKRMEVKDE